MSWDVIIPFLRPIELLLRDPEITDILVNGSAVFAEKAGEMEIVSGVTISEKSLQAAVRNIARVLGDDISEQTPLLDARLPDGSRVAAIFPPCSVNGTTLAIRKFQSKRYDGSELVRVGTLSQEMLDWLADAVALRRSLLISGRTGAGKTTFLNALTTFIAEQERVVVIEDTTELQVNKANLVRLEARRAQEGVAAVTIRELLRQTLRLRPDRIVVGEIRGAEAFDWVQALNTGHRGTLATTHANSAPESLERVATYALMSEVNLSRGTLCRHIALGLDVVVHLDLQRGKRVVTEIGTVTGFDDLKDQFEVQRVFAA